MSSMILLTALAVLSACTDSESDAPALDPKPAATLFDGADYADEAAKIAHGKRLA